MNTIQTHELALAALLVAKGCQLTGYALDGLSQMRFEFEDTAEAHQLEVDYHLARAEVNLYKYNSAQKMLKALIYDHRKTNYERTLRIPNQHTV